VQRTAFLSRLIGLFALFFALSMMVQKQANIDTMNALVHDTALLWVVGTLMVLAGLVLVLTHNVWSGGALPIVVTAIGWLALIKGLLFLLLPPAWQSGFLAAVHYEEWYYKYAAYVFVLGGYLTWAGFKLK
jgi:hypothetical protein